MDARMKTMGLAALVAVALAFLAISFKQSFLNEPPRAGEKEAAAMKASMESAIKEAQAREAAQPRGGGGGGGDNSGKATAPAEGSGSR